MQQIQFLLGHASVQTTERYLGCKQNLGHPVNDLFQLGALAVDGLFYLAVGAGFVADHKAQGDRLDFGHLFKAYRDQFPFLIGGSDEDPFEHRQIDLAQERLGNLGLQIERLPGGHLSTNDEKTMKRTLTVAICLLALTCAAQDSKELREELQQNHNCQRVTCSAGTCQPMENGPVTVCEEPPRKTGERRNIQVEGPPGTWKTVRQECHYHTIHPKHYIIARASQMNLPSGEGAGQQFSTGRSEAQFAHID